MNAKELRRAAEIALAESVEARRLYGLLNDVDSPELPSEAVFRHILSTVRDDDDEAIDEAWLRSQSRTDGLLLTMMTFVRRFDGYHLEVNGHESVKPTTRGDFRALCRLLGVTLKEEE